ncbi:HDIG domain-containing protein [Candidatus Woesearchaeota archaeon]|nr:HDIG domain-containing protein [Candidatus Woesearchaeota archaeon]
MNEKDAVRILREFAPNVEVFQIIYRHTNFVKKLALEIAETIKCDRLLVATGAILHDIGRFTCPPNTKKVILHGLRGAKILRGLGYKKHARIAERHIGVGITKQDIIDQKLNLPLRNFTPQTIEEKIVCYADKLADFDQYAPYKKTLERFKKDLGPHIEKRFLGLRKELLDAGMNEKF